MDTAQIMRFLRGTGTMSAAFHNGTYNLISECNDGSGYGSGIARGAVSGCRDRAYEWHGARDGKSYYIDAIELSKSGGKNGVGYGTGNVATGDGNRRGEGLGGKYQRGVCNVDNAALSVLTYNGEPVYVVDGIPCVFKTVHDVWAKVDVINRKDFTARTAFIGKCKGFFAHGETLRKALQDAKAKYFRNIDFESKKEELKRLFSRSADKKLPVSILYEWHGILTGSCRFGRDEFMRTHALKDDDRLTLNEFVDLTAAHFGGDKIQKLTEET